MMCVLSRFQQKSFKTIFLFLIRMSCLKKNTFVLKSRYSYNFRTIFLTVASFRNDLLQNPYFSLNCLSYFAEKRIALQRNYSLVVWKMNHFLPGRHSFKYKSSDYATQQSTVLFPLEVKKRRFAGKEPTPISK